MKASELVEALREYALIDECEGGNPVVIATERAAADLIEAQAKTIEEMRSALIDLAYTHPSEVDKFAVYQVEAREFLASHSQEGEQG